MTFKFTPRFNATHEARADVTLARPQSGGMLSLKSSDKPPDSVDCSAEEGKSHWVRAGTSVLWLSDRLGWSPAEFNWEISDQRMSLWSDLHGLRFSS